MSTVDVRNPYTGEYDYQFQDPAPSDVAAKAARLRENQTAWAAMELDDRLTALEAFGASVAKHSAAITAALKTDTGRTQVAELEVNAIQGFAAKARNDAALALTPGPARPAMIPAIEGTANHIPYGVIGNISPWNFPVILSFLDTFPALAAGNAVLIKPSEVTPRWVEPMLEAIKDCPEISGVLDIIVGTGPIGAALIQEVDGVVFTGSVATGRKERSPGAGDSHSIADTPGRAACADRARRGTRFVRGTRRCAR